VYPAMPGPSQPPIGQMYVAPTQHQYVSRVILPRVQSVANFHKFNTTYHTA
jgi:hypothetical protein